jgi:KaiC/GvpD/RAD55 family RecA-like ATPase
MEESHQRVSTGIPGLDEMIEGGFPTETVNLISGPAGSAKSLLGMQFIYTGARDHDEVGVYLTLEERRENLRRAMTNFDMDIEKYEKEGKIFLMDIGKIRARVRSEAGVKRGMVGFEKLIDFLANFLKTTNAKRIVLDSISAAGIYYHSSEELRQELFSFVVFLQEMKITSLLITESLNDTGDNTPYGIEQFITDSFLNLALEKVSGDLRRSITVRKMRFTKHDTRVHPFLITKKGIVIYSETEVF